MQSRDTTAVGDGTMRHLDGVRAASGHATLADCFTAPAGGHPRSVAPRAARHQSDGVGRPLIDKRLETRGASPNPDGPSGRDRHRCVAAGRRPPSVYSGRPKQISPKWSPVRRQQSAINKSLNGQSVGLPTQVCLEHFPTKRIPVRRRKCGKINQLEKLRDYNAIVKRSRAGCMPCVATVSG